MKTRQESALKKIEKSRVIKLEKKGDLFMSREEIIDKIINEIKEKYSKIK